MSASAIILAAGAGTRMKSNKPKVAHEILGKSLVEYVIAAARAAQCDRIATVIGHKREQVLPLVAGTEVIVQEEQAGTADAVQACREAFADVQGSLLVLNGDCPLITPETLSSLVAYREEHDAAVAVLTMDMQDPTGYGRIVRGEGGLVERIVEQKDANEVEAAITECNSGFYCFDAQALFDALEKVSCENAQGEYYLTDVLEICRDQGRNVVALTTQDTTECLGVNSRVQLAQATRVMRDRINLAHMEAGVTMVDPETTWIGPDVTIDADVELLPMVTMLGNTHVSAGTTVGPNSRLVSTTVGSGCIIDETIAIETVIEDDCDCGPRAYLRAGTHLCEGAKAGSHVEIKKSTIGKGSKVPHLSYIGDTMMGDGVNIGAGSITCNYDGENKWPTTIGDNAFIGSDTMMVAPVTIGEDTLIGAGSVITNDVPAHALGLGRARQFVKLDYMTEKRENHGNV